MTDDGSWRRLCRLEELRDGAARGFAPVPGGLLGLLVVRRGEGVFVYVNSCPHLGVRLDWAPHRFLDPDGERIVCGTHGAEFAIGSGVCLRGPCAGERLERVLVAIEDGEVLVPADAGL